MSDMDFFFAVYRLKWQLLAAMAIAVAAAAALWLLVKGIKKLADWLLERMNR